MGPTKIDSVSKSERDLTTAASSIIKNPGMNSQMSMGERRNDDLANQI
jgi:hypothetical protein